MKRCCFFGHAHYPYEGCRDTIKSIVKDLIEHHGVTVFYSGGRGDFDGICARIVGELRKDHWLEEINRTYSIAYKSPFNIP